MPVRFKFCGDDTVPDWILKAIDDISRMDEKKLKTLVTTALEGIFQLNDTIDIEKKAIRTDSSDADKACVAAVLFIMKSATTYGITENILSNELQQIGLPTEHAIILSNVYAENVKEMKSKLRQQLLRCSVPKNIVCTVDNQEDGVLDLKAWQLNSNQNETYKIHCSREQLESILYEMKSVYEKIQKTL